MLGWQIHKQNITLNAHGIATSPSLPPPLAQCTYTIGDLHANVLKLIAFLKFVGLIETADFNSLVDAYNSKNHQQFMTTAVKIVFTKNTQNISLILLGDTLFDRGKSDFMMLVLFEQMATAKINFTILVSNHDLIFIQQLEQTRKNSPLNFNFLDVIEKYRAKYSPKEFAIQKQTYQSFDIRNLNYVFQEVATGIYENVFKPRLKIVVQHRVYNQYFVYSHAPCEIQSLYDLANLDHRTIYSPNKLIETINGEQDSILNKHCQACNFYDPMNGNGALFAFVWNRYLSKTFTKEIINVFGHIGELNEKAWEHDLQDNQINLDTNLGRPGYAFGLLKVMQVAA